MRTTLWIAGLALVVVAAVLAAQERPGSPRPAVARTVSGPALDEIQAEQMAAHLQTETRRWGRWVKMAKIEPQ